MSQLLTTPITQHEFSRAVAAQRPIRNQSFQNTVFNKGNYKGMKFTNCDFSGVDFQAVAFQDCSFMGCDMRGSHMDGCSIINTTFAHCMLERQHIEHVHLWNIQYNACTFTDSKFGPTSGDMIDFTQCYSIIDAGQDIRGYRFFAVRNTETGYMVKAGCRWYDPGTAFRHWIIGETSRHISDIAASVKHKIMLIRGEATARGWT